jgi:hypothetical protein
MQSPALYTALRNHLISEDGCPKIPLELDDAYITVEDVEQFIQFLYSGSCSVKVHRLMALLQLSHRYQVCPSINKESVFVKGRGQMRSYAIRPCWNSFLAAHCTVRLAVRCLSLVFRHVGEQGQNSILVWRVWSVTLSNGFRIFSADSLSGIC